MVKENQYFSDKEIEILVKKYSIPLTKIESLVKEYNANPNKLYNKDGSITLDDSEIFCDNITDNHKFTDDEINSVLELLANELK